MTHMTSAERVIYAVSFAKEYAEVRNPPPYIVLSEEPEGLDIWEKEQAVSACEFAAHTVQRHREVLALVGTAFGEDSDVYLMAREIGIEDPDA